MSDGRARSKAPVQILATPPRPERKPAEPCAMVIFGARGDLTRRLIVPALYNLTRSGLLSEHFSLIGVSLGDETTESWRAHLREMLQSYVGRPSAELKIDKIDE